MGLGKTRCCVEVANLEKCRKVLVICPKAVINTWSEEYQKWGNGTLEVISDDMGKTWSVDKIADELKRRMQFKHDFIITVNFAKIVQSKDKINKLTQLLFTTEWDMIIVDEAHKIKQHNGGSAKTCHKLGKLNYNAIKVAQSGTPLPNSPLSAFSQYQFLDNEVFGESYNYFQKKYFMIGEYNQYVALWDKDGFKKKLHSRMISFEEGLVSLPESMHQGITIDLEPKALKIYKEIEKNFYVELDKGELTVNIALTKLLRLSQVTGGFIPLDDGGYEQVSNAKAEALEELLDDISVDEPVVIFYRFDTDKTQIIETVKKSKRQLFELSGKKDELNEWKSSTTGDVLIVQIQSGNAGVSFVRSMYCIYYSIGYSETDLEQSIKRLHRSGQERNVMYHHILCKGTVDEKIYKKISSKMKVARDILDTSNSDSDIIAYLLENRE